MEFIRAGINFTDELRKIAHESEAYWGYDHGYMTKFDSEFNITKKFIATHPVYFGHQAGKIFCFWGILKKSDFWELEYFYISRDSIGEGYGRKMWLHMINWCIEHHVKTIEWVTSPEAVGFYLKMGAKQTGTAISVLNGRKIPKFSLVLNG